MSGMGKRIDFYDDPDAPRATSLVPSANVVVTNADGDILLIRRSDNGNWALPGGAMDLGESLPDAAVRERHREALVAAATSGNPRYFLGTDSAPHAKNDKESDCGCAGCYTALHALELYATAFERAGALEKLEGFASHFGPDFYRLPRNNGTITLERAEWRIPDALPFAGRELVPLAAGESLGWRTSSVFRRAVSVNERCR